MALNRWSFAAAGVSLLLAGASMAALPPERTLAGIRVGTKGNIVLHRFGNPSVVAPGLGEVGTGTTAITGSGPANPYALGPGGLPPGIAGPYGASMPGMPPRMPGVPPRMPGVPPPGMFAPSGLPPAGAPDTGAATDQTADNTGLTTWTYRKVRGGPTLDFRLNEDGTVVEIVATGFSPSPLARTSRGVTLGDPYGKVMRLYGFPEETTQQGNIMTVKYSRAAHIAFQFYKLKVVRIDVALPRPSVNLAP